MAELGIGLATQFGLFTIEANLTLPESFNSISLRFRVERLKYRDSIKRLLHPILSQSEFQTLRPRLENSPEDFQASALLQTLDIERKLRYRLNDHYDVLMDVIVAADACLKTLTNKLDIIPQEKQDKSHNAIRRGFKKLSRSFSMKEIQVALKELVEHNSTICQWLDVRRDEIPLPPRRDCTEDFVKNYDNVRCQARQLYDILEHAWDCSCVDSHDVHLQLERQQGLDVFQVYFSLQPPPTKGQHRSRVWRESHISLQAIEEAAYHSPTCTVKGKSREFGWLSTSRNDLPTIQSGQTNAKIIRPPASEESSKWIKCLCEALQSAERGHQHLGGLADPLQRICASLTTTISGSAMLGFTPPVRLGLLLQSKSGSMAKRLSVKDRLGIAVTLSSAVLQLYESPWLADFWSQKDIYAFNKDEEDTCPSAGNLYVLQSFSSPAANSASGAKAMVHQSFAPYILNKTLFSLGIVLIELCLNQPFAELRSLKHRDAADENHPVLRDYEVANSWIDDVYSEFGISYGEVVQRCIRCEFSGPDREKRMDLYSFRRLVYQGVVAPLKHDYEKFF